MTDIPTFDSYDEPVPDPRSFRLRGRSLLTDEPWVEDFQVVGWIPQGPLADLAGALTIENGRISYRTPTVVRFLRQVLVAGDVARFNELIEDKHRPVNIDQLGAVMLWAAGIETERPTGPQSGSTSGLRDDSPGSEDAGSPPDTTGEPSPV